MIGRAALTIACIAASVAPMAAQGNGHGHAYGLLKSSTGTPSSGGAARKARSSRAAPWKCQPRLA